MDSFTSWRLKLCVTRIPPTVSAIVAEILQQFDSPFLVGDNDLMLSATAGPTALSVLDTIVADDLCANAERMGTRLMDGLRTRLAGLQSVVEVRGRGLMVGIELREPCTELMSAALARGLLINVTADSVIRLLPPLIIGAAEIDQIVATLGELIEAREHACANPG